MIRDQIGVLDEKLKVKLLKTEKLDLKKAISVCKTNELVKIQSKEMSQGKRLVNAVWRGEESHGSCPREGPESSSSQEVPKLPKETPGLTKDCGYCGSSHLKMKCPAYGKKCASCGI